MAITANSAPAQAPRIHDGSAHLFVPYNAGRAPAGANDAKSPGAILRLGGYSSVEADATDHASFYPRHHLEDEGFNALSNAVGPAANGYRGGILLACDGRMLLRSGEKFYLHSKSAMDIDTETTLDIAAGAQLTMASQSTMLIRTYNKSGLTISADDGNAKITQTSATSTTQINGDKYTHVTSTDRKFVEADTYSYRLGNSYSVIGGMTHSVNAGLTAAIFGGVALSFNLAVTLAIKLSRDFTFYFEKMDMGVTKIDICVFKLELKNAKMEASVNVVKSSATSTKTAAVDTKTAAVDSTQTSVNASVEAVTANNGGPEVRTRALSCHF